MRAIILGAGFGFESGFSEHSHPTAVHEVSSGRHVLDYLIDALKSLNVHDIVFVAGYHIEQVVNRYPFLSYVYNPVWRDTGPVHSLQEAEERLSGDVLISYADVLLSETAVKELLDCDSDFAILEDKNWIDRYERRGSKLQHEAEKVVSANGRVVQVGRHILEQKEKMGQFAGMIKVRGKATERLRSILTECSQMEPGVRFHESESFEKAGMTDLLQEMIRRGETITTVAVRDRWAELDAPQDIAQFVFGTKAETLERLQGSLTRSIILDQIRISLEEWRSRREEALIRIQMQFPSQRLAIRSSARNEDSWHVSNAGRYVSFLDIDSESRTQVGEFIEKVFASYDENDLGHQCLIQPFLKDVSLAGVAFTRDAETAAPYYILSYEVSGSTDGVTSGKLHFPSTLIVSRTLNRSTNNAMIDRLLAAFREIEQIVGYDSLDIEFAMQNNEEIYILQVRPLVANRKLQYFSDSDITQEIDAIKESVRILNDRSNLLVGRRSVLGVMPDWNPAEIIGRSPRPLALTLYQYLIVDETWGIQRAEYGYRSAYPVPLVVGLGGQGYVDVRASFNSFIPATVPDDLAARLVDHYIDRLVEMPHLHDKVEFEVAFTCFSFDFDVRARRFAESGFLQSEIASLREKLLELTRNALRDSPVFFEKQLKAVETLKKRRTNRLTRNGPSTPTSVLRLIHQMLAESRRFGTLPFAHLARSAFVATELLRSLVRLGVIEQKDCNQLLENTKTVAGDLAFDLKALQFGAISREKFLETYGHLRPGTYDILSPRYDQNPNGYFSFEKKLGNLPLNAEPSSFSFSPNQQRDINKLLVDFDLGIDVDQLIEFIRRSIQGREYSKFEFTRELSDALELIGSLGDLLGLTRDDMSFVPIHDILRFASNSGSGVLKNELMEIIERNRSRYQVTKALHLPHLIVNSSDVECFFLETASPNFITQKHVTGRLFRLGDEYSGENLDGLIIHIESADPGFDWIFGHQILGLLTTYGGANSHMAIRAAEFGLPAAIGCGEALVQVWRTGDTIDLNCEAKQIHVIG
ncbi:MAG: NTP transferase domain-containing protein [Anaerolineales bacterium]|nr:NTP transferase domain-containing protein [Anaerolineales bacterium]